MASSTTRGAFPFPASTDPDDVPAYLQQLADRIAAVGALYVQGLAAARGAAGVAGRFYLATDTLDVSYDTGTAWVDLLSAADATTAFAMGLVRYLKLGTSQTGITTDHQWATVTVPAVAGRSYRLTAAALVSSTANGDSASGKVRWNDVDIAGAFASDYMEYSGGTSGYWIERNGIVTAAATGDVIVGAVVARVVGTGTLTVSNAGSYLAVEDLGVL